MQFPNNLPQLRFAIGIRKCGNRLLVIVTVKHAQHVIPDLVDQVHGPAVYIQYSHIAIHFHTVNQLIFHLPNLSYMKTAPRINRELFNTLVFCNN